MAYTDNNTDAATTPADALATVADMIREAEKHADDLSSDRITAMEYYDGVMRDTPADKGRSSVVSRDVRTNIKKVLPSIMRTMFGSSNVVEYQPVGPRDEEGAQQASDYVNRVIAPETDMRRHVEDAIHDALLLRNGILRWWWEEKKCAQVSEHTGLTEFAFAELVSDDEVEVLEHSERPELVEIEALGPDGQPIPPQEIIVHDVKIRRVTAKRCVRVSCVPRERFLIHPDAIDVQDSILTGERVRMTRSDLIAMGYDYDLVMGLQQAGEDDTEEDVRRDAILNTDEAHRPNELIDYYDVFVRYDMDGDGIAELRHMCFAGGLGERNLLMDEEATEVQFCDIKTMARPHQWEGISLADDLRDIQRIKTVLMRQTLDNIYWQNNPQPIMQDGAVKDMDAVMNPEFGKPIRVQQGISVRDAYGFSPVPFVAQQSFAMLEYLDNEAQDRTGVSDASAGLAPDALQNMTATASEMLNQAGIGQTEMMVRTVASGLRDFFKGILRLIVRHQDVARTVRLRGEWVEFDPRHWNTEMDCTVNVGLGAGTRERDMQLMQYVMGMQEKLIAAFGPDNPYVKPENLWEALSKSAESAGLQTPELYFTEPDPQEIQQKMEQMRNQPDPEQMKMQAQMQLEQAKLQADMQKAEMQAKVARDKEEAQMQADLTVGRERLQADAALSEQKLAWEREKLMMQQRLELVKMGLEQNEAGEPINAQAEAMRAMLAQTQSMMQALASQVEQSNRPKRVVRDDMGEIIGVEPVMQ